MPRPRETPTLTVQLLPDDTAQCMIVSDGVRCESMSLGARMTGRSETGTVFTAKLCSSHAARVAGMIDGRQIVTGESRGDA
jgi:hypothetical protein